MGPSSESLVASDLEGPNTFTPATPRRSTRCPFNHAQIRRALLGGCPLGVVDRQTSGAIYFIDCACPAPGVSCVQVSGDPAWGSRPQSLSAISAARSRLLGQQRPARRDRYSHPDCLGRNLAFWATSLFSGAAASIRRHHSPAGRARLLYNSDGVRSRRISRQRSGDRTCQLPAAAMYANGVSPCWRCDGQRVRAGSGVVSTGQSQCC